MELNLLKKSFQPYPYHIVESSPWPLLMSFAVFSMMNGGVLYFNNISFGGELLTLGFLSTLFRFILWFRDITTEGTYLGDHTLIVQKGLTMGVAFFILTEAFFFLTVFWALKEFIYRDYILKFYFRVLLFSNSILLRGTGYAIIGNNHPNNKPKILSLSDLPNDPEFFKLYSSLIGLLATNGRTIHLGNKWFWYKKTVQLRLSSTDNDFLIWLAHYFYSRHFYFNGREIHSHSTSKSYQVFSLFSNTCYLIWLHWNEEGIYRLPTHFAEYFSIYTLSFWAIRNGQWIGNYFYIYVNQLNNQEKELLISLIEDKLGFKSKLAKNNTILAIYNPEKLRELIKPYFHTTQINRLIKK